MTVLENVRVAVQSDSSAYDFWSRIDDNEGITAKAEAVLERVGLEYKSDEPAASLSHGEQRTLEIAVALGANPDLLLLDEPSSGMSPEETQDIIDLIEDLSDSQPIIFIEHKMSVVRRVADRILVLHNGRKLAEGPPKSVQANEQVQQVYLGEEQL
jgi:branched-chain amino acid transport system ATP-binding protein